MNYNDLEKRVFSRTILASNGSHSGRVWRVAENVREHARTDSSDDRLLHVMSRVGVLCRTLAEDMRTGYTSAEDAATILDQLADIGDLSFEDWLGRDRS